MKFRMVTSKNVSALLLAVFLLIPVLGFSQLAPSQTAGLNRDRLTRDLRIMEGILDKLLRGSSSRYGINGHTKGVYLPGYGVVFHTSPQTPSWDRARYVYADQLEHIQELRARVIDEHADMRERIDRHAEVIIEEKVQQVDEALEQAEVLRGEIVGLEESELLDEEDLMEEEWEAIDGYKENLSMFFRNYSSAISQLKPEDHIAVLVNLQDWTIAETDNTFLFAWITRQDVDRYRRNQLDESEFWDRLHFEYNEAEEQINTDIVIMTEILERALETTPFVGIETNNGIYLNGLGALLFLEVPGVFVVTSSSGENVSVVIQENVENAIAYSTGKATNEKKRNDRGMEDIEADLFDLMASYGHTLRLKPDESIILNVDMGGGFFSWADGKKAPSRVMLGLKKRDVDEYNRGVLSLDELKKKLVRQTY